MQLAEVSIRRPVFATVLSLLIVLVGAVSFNRLSLREYPKIDEPVVTVSVRYAGASAEVIESQVIKPLEDSIAGIDAVDVITSISRADQAQISVRFRLEKDADSAAAEVRDRTSRVRNRLPQAIEEPVIAKVEADAFPVIQIAFSSESMTPLQINDLVNRIVKPRLQTVTGVADVRIFGERKYAMRVWLDSDRLAAFRLTTQDVEDAIRRSNLELPAGRIESQQREFSVTSQTALVKPAQFGEIVIRNINGFAVKLKDVARVQEGAADERTAVRLNGRSAVAVGVIRQATANPLDLSKGVREVLPKLKADLPPDLLVDVANDNSVFIDRSVKNVYTTIIEAIVLVALVIFVFLRTLRASIIPLVTIPVSLVGTFALMSLAGFSVNTLTLLALVLAIGLVVDDAIVMLENIFRHIEESMDPFSAGIKGAREIGFAIVTMTATLVAVYAPLAFTLGRTGRLFVEFALALAGAVLVSGFVALTLTPMMCTLLLRYNPKPNRFDRGMEKLLTALSGRYGAALRWVVSARYQPPADAPGQRQPGLGQRVTGFILQARWLVVALMLASALAIALVFPTMKQELSPLEDRGVILANVTAPDGATLDYTNRYAQALEAIGQPYQEFDRIFASVGNPTVAQATVVYRTVDWVARKRSTLDIARELQPKFNALPGVTAFPITPPSLGQGFRERPLNFVIQTSDSYQNLNTVVTQILAEIAKNPGIVRSGLWTRPRPRCCRPATADLNGTSREFRNSQGALAIVFVLALLFIFLVLAAQFESFVDPLVIMLSVPLSMIGALLALKWSGGSLNVYSQIGLITLVGLITKHGILIVEFTNQLRGQGMEMIDALVKASSQRLRPILMTTGAMVLGALPLALAHGAGAESRTQIGWVIVGGMSLGTLLTIFVLPTMYSLFARKAIPGANQAVASLQPEAHPKPAQ